MKCTATYHIKRVVACFTSISVVFRGLGPTGLLAFAFAFAFAVVGVVPSLALSFGIVFDAFASALVVLGDQVLFEP